MVVSASETERDMAKTVGDFVWERLYAWGVRRIFGYPGDGINGLLGGLARFGTDKIQFVQARHEENGRVHGLGLCQVHRRTRRLHRHIRSWCLSPLICSPRSYNSIPLCLNIQRSLLGREN